jgi:GNAT superfamily N-acetyltransferase
MSNMPNILTIRAAIADDLLSLHALFAEDGMPIPARDDLLSGSVAINQSGKVVGFIRILYVDDTANPAANGAYVYPVIVFKSWHHRGVGRALIMYELEHCGELRLVACRSSRDFYPRCGFEPLDWSCVASRIARDCELCPDHATCDPQPFILKS